MGTRGPRWLVTFVTAALAVCAAAQAPEIRVVAGYDGAVDELRPLPLRIDVTAAGGPAVGRISVPRRLSELGVPRAVYSVAVDCPAGGTKRYWMTVPAQRSAAEIRLEADFRGAGHSALAVPVTAVEPGAVLVGVVTPSRAGLRFLNRRPLAPKFAPLPGATSVPGYAEVFHVANLGYDDLPPDTAAYSSLDALVIAGDGFGALPARVKESIAAWVTIGGRLVLVGGVESAGLWQDPVIERLAPARVDGLAYLERGEFGPLLRRFGGEFRARGGPFAVSRVAAVRSGDVVRSASGTPLVVDAPFGGGSVAVVAASFEQPPISDWTGQKAFWTRLLAGQRQPAPQPLERWRALRSGAARISADQAPSAALVAGFLLAYLVVLIPVQFIVLRRLDRREASWVVTPAIVLVFSLAAYFVGTRTKGRELQLRTMSLFEGDAGQAIGRLTSTAVLYSPAKARYQVELPESLIDIAELADQPMLGYGYDDDGLARHGQLRLEQQDGKTRIPRLAVDMWSVRLLGLEQAHTLGGPITATLERSGDRWRCRVVNYSQATVRGAVIRAGKLTARLGDLQPGAKVSKQLGAGGGELVALLAPPPNTGLVEAGLVEATSRLLSARQENHWMPGPTAQPLDAGSAALWGWVVQDTAPFELEGGGLRAHSVTLMRLAVATPPSGELLHLRPRGSDAGGDGGVSVYGNADSPTLVAFDLPDGAAERLAGRLLLRATVTDQMPAAYVWQPESGAWDQLHREGQGEVAWPLESPRRLLCDGQTIYLAFVPVNSYGQSALRDLRLEEAR